MELILERIAKSLESIASELKTGRKDREAFKQQLEQMESAILSLKNDPFGLKEKEYCIIGKELVNYGLLK